MKIDLKLVLEELRLIRNGGLKSAPEWCALKGIADLLNNQHWVGNEATVLSTAHVITLPSSVTTRKEVWLHIVGCSLCRIIPIRILNHGWYLDFGVIQKGVFGNNSMIIRVMKKEVVVNEKRNDDPSARAPSSGIGDVF